MNKKIVSILVIGWLLIISFSVFVNAEDTLENEQIVIDYSFEKPSLNKIVIDDVVYDQLNMNNSPCFGNPGEPGLPAKGAYILISQGEKVRNINVKYSNIICLGSDFLVEPVGEPVPLSQMESAPVPLLSLSPSMYMSLTTIFLLPV